MKDNKSEKAKIQTEKDSLRAYLRQYKDAKRRKNELENRLKAILYDFKNPLKGSNPNSTYGNGISEGAASLTFRLEEIEERITCQRLEMEKAINRVLDIIDYLSETSIERRILELRYIDFLKWDKISQEVFMSRSRCEEIESNALDHLLKYERIKAIIKDYEEKGRILQGVVNNEKI